MGCVPAQLCRQALADATRSFPNRNRGSDGICGDAKHQARKSDHNLGNAFDITHDPGDGCDIHAFAEQVKQQKPGWCKYIISNARIWNPSVSSGWRPYGGTNPHRAHCHFSINSNWRDAKGVVFPWSPGAVGESKPPPPDEDDNMQLIPKYAPDNALHYFYVADGGDLYHAWWPRSGDLGRKAENLGAKFDMGGTFDGQPSVTVDEATSNTIHVVCDRKGSSPPAHFFYAPGKSWTAD